MLFFLLILSNLEHGFIMRCMRIQAKAELRFQFALRALAHVGRNNNDFEIKLKTEPAEENKGLQEELIWKETGEMDKKEKEFSPDRPGGSVCTETSAFSCQLKTPADFPAERRLPVPLPAVPILPATV